MARDEAVTGKSAYKPGTNSRLTDTNLLAIFGSTSDELKVLPGIQKATQELHAQGAVVSVDVRFASADNTPEKVAELMEEWRAKRDASGQPGVIISGAGMSNVLTGVCKTYTNLGDLVIGVPITDRVTKGLSARLSTGEKPPYNPVLMTLPDNEGSRAAVHIAHRWLCKKPSRIVLARSSYAVPKTQKDALDEFGLPYAMVDADELYLQKASLQPQEADSVIVTAASPEIIIDNYHYIANLSHQAGQGNGIVLRVPGSINGINSDMPRGYDNRCLGFVGINAYPNAAIMAAILTRNRGALEKIGKAREERANKLRAHRGYVVKNGTVTPHPECKVYTNE